MPARRKKPARPTKGRKAARTTPVLRGEAAQAGEAWRAFRRTLEAIDDSLGLNWGFRSHVTDAEKFYVAVRDLEDYRHLFPRLWAWARECAGLFFPRALNSDMHSFVEAAVSDQRLSGERAFARQRGWSLAKFDELLAQQEDEAQAAAPGAPDSRGFVARPHEYIAANEIISASRDKLSLDYKSLNRILVKHTEIRRWRPSPRRLMIHLADWRLHLSNLPPAGAAGKAKEPSREEIQQRAGDLRRDKRGPGPRG